MIEIKVLYSQNLDQIKTETGVANAMALPKISKVTLNVGLGQDRLNKDKVAYIAESLGKISGQKAVFTTARKAIAGFKIRQGDVVGVRVTLRGQRMTDFLNRLLNITLPRIRDFKGFIEGQLDRQGNLTIGFKDQVPFAELGHDVLEKPFGLSVVITVKKSDPKKSLALLRALGFPLKSR